MTPGTGPVLGQVVAGRYRVERLLAQGSRKQVHLAHDCWLERQVVVCTLRPDVATPQEQARLRREAGLLARLGDHEGIVTVHDYLVADDEPVLVCQYVPGGSLQDLLERQVLPVATVLATGRDLAAALGHVHAHGIVHRDVKPANVWLNDAGRPVLGDFGLATATSDAQSGGWPFVGTAPYLAPEQALGGPVDVRADLYSLGVVLRELLRSDRPAPSGGPANQVWDAVHAGLGPDARERADVPAELDALVLRLLAPDPADRPSTAAEVAEELARLADRSRPAAVPVAPASPTGPGFVGRSPELVALRAALQQAREGRGGLTLLLGEAGMGKTRTALELAASASQDGWLVLPGRCHDGDGAPALWPWTQVLRAALRQRPEEMAGFLSGRAAAALSGLLPELGAPDAAPPAPADADSGRFQLFDAVASSLRALAAAGPVLVVVDDAHWADAASLALLRFLGRQLVDAPVALLACLRPLAEDAATGPTALERLAASASRTLSLEGLSLHETRRFLDLTVGVRPAEPLLRSLHARTEGNPFFLGELVRLLLAEHRIAEDGTLLPGQTLIPKGVEDVLRRRLAHVSPNCAGLLRSASVLGREARSDVLCEVVQAAPEELMPLLDEACRAHMLVALPGSITRYRFSHALVHEALYEELPATERVQLHQRAASALATAHRGDPDAHAAEIAHHHVRGLPAGDVPSAVRWCVRAGRAASTAAAHEDAAAHYARALSLAESLYRQGPAAPTALELGELLLALGDAQCRAGRTEEGRASFQRAADLGLLHGDATLLAQAALGYGVGLGGYGFVETADGMLIALLEQALDALDTADGPLRLRVLARLATELHFTPFRQRRLLVSDEALEMARRLGDPADELVALYSRTVARLGPDDVEERRAAAERIVRLAGALGDRELAFRGHHLRLNCALETGAMEQVRADVAACRRLADEQGLPMQRCYAAVFEASLELLEGDLLGATRLAEGAFALGRRGHAGMAAVLHGAQLLAVRWAQGRIGELVDAVRLFADELPHAPAWRAALAFCYAELGCADAARAELEALAARGFADLPRDGNHLTALTLLAHVAAQVGDLERGAELEQMLAPYADRNVVIAAGAVAFTSVELPLGVLRAAAGDLTGALERLARARQAHEARGARPYVVWTAQEQVRVLLRRGAPGDLEAARELLAQALSTAREVGMAAHVERLAEMASALPDPGPPTLLLTDVAGSTALTEQLGEQVMHGLLREHARAAAEAASRHGGKVLKSLGDGVLIVFDAAGAALRCAADLQREAEQGPLRLRIGVHTGQVLQEGESMYGRTVILAFRVAARSRAGEVLLTAETRQAASGDDSGLVFDDGRRLRLKGIEEPHVVHRLLWCGVSAAGPYPGPAAPPTTPTGRWRPPAPRPDVSGRPGASPVVS